ncbi:hypothetical protein TNCV_2160581 [Trichonephila clavipes]|nr:hypothetical protein TNCV_2160581 [Trichonephila clavipes]
MRPAQSAAMPEWMVTTCSNALDSRNNPADNIVSRYWEAGRQEAKVLRHTRNLPSIAINYNRDSSDQKRFTSHLEFKLYAREFNRGAATDDVLFVHGL